MFFLMLGQRGRRRNNIGQHWFRPKQNICLFPICCQFNQWGPVGNLFYFIFYFIFCHFNQSVGKNFILFGAKFTFMHVLSVHYVTIFCFF